MAWLLLVTRPAPAQERLPYRSLASYLEDLEARLPGAGSEAFVRPSDASYRAFKVGMDSLFRGEITQARGALGALNYDLSSLDDEEYDRTYVVVHERAAGFKGLGTYVVYPGYARNLVFEVPHPIADALTLAEGGLIFQELEARALVLAGTHRCADLSVASGCSGSTQACSDADQPYRISDAAHFTQSFFQATHEATLGLRPPPVTINLHGNGAEVPEVELSDGTRNPASAESAVNRLRDALAARGVSVASCNREPDHPASLNLCGLDNVQGRLSNGSPDPCRVKAPEASGRFLHIEQLRNIREAPRPLIEALAEVFPAPAAAAR
jgi:hypothetical protein